MEKFEQDIIKFNNIYKLEGNDQPTALPIERIENFVSILKEEVEESSDIIAKYRSLTAKSGLDEEGRLAILTEMSDWLGDIVVYCASEARRWGLPLTQILDVIMQSNFSKLGADGEPIYDQRGKVLKGPDYWRPEPKISELLQKK